MKDNLRMFVDFSARLKAMRKLVGMYNSIRQVKTHEPVEMFFRFNIVLFSGDTARSQCTFLVILNKFNVDKHKWLEIYKIKRIIKDTEREITKPFL